jgi:hypothetical protein
MENWTEYIVLGGSIESDTEIDTFYRYDPDILKNMGLLDDIMEDIQFRLESGQGFMQGQEANGECETPDGFVYSFLEKKLKAGTLKIKYVTFECTSGDDNFYDFYVTFDIPLKDVEKAFDEEGY